MEGDKNNENNGQYSIQSQPFGETYQIPSYLINEYVSLRRWISMNTKSGHIICQELVSMIPGSNNNWQDVEK